jgi:hypothetical protein
MADSVQPDPIDVQGICKNVIQWGSLAKRAPKGHCRPAAPPNRHLNKQILKTMLANVLRDLPFSQNQPVKSADH